MRRLKAACVAEPPGDYGMDFTA